MPERVEEGSGRCKADMHIRWRTVEDGCGRCKADMLRRCRREWRMGVVDVEEVSSQGEGEKGGGVWPV